MAGQGFFLFIGNGGGVLLAYDDGEFTVPGRASKPKRIRFPASAPDHALKPATVPEQVESAAEVDVSAKDGSLETGVLETQSSEKKVPDEDGELF